MIEDLDQSLNKKKTGPIRVSPESQLEDKSVPYAKLQLSGKVGNTDLADDSITNDKISSGANIEIAKTDFLSSSSSGVTHLGSSAATANQSITTLADITNCSVTVNVPSGGRVVKISGYVRGISADGPRNITVNIMEGASQLQTHIWTASGASAQNVLTPSVTLIPSSGSHTYKLQASANGGTFDLQAATTAPNYILVELV